MAVGMACSDRRRHSWMVGRDGLGRRRDRSMASRLVELEMLGCLDRCAKHHAPQGEVDFNCDIVALPQQLFCSIVGNRIFARHAGTSL